MDIINKIYVTYPNRTDEVVAVNAARGFNIHKIATDMSTSIFKKYGKWLKENSETYKIDVESTFHDDNTITLRPFISFVDDSEAMAFKLRWT